MLFRRKSQSRTKRRAAAGVSSEEGHPQTQQTSTPPRQTTPASPGAYFAETEPFWPTGKGVYQPASGLRPTHSVSRGHRVSQWLSHVAYRYPARLTVSVFALLILVVTLLLSIPAASATGRHTPFVDALFTAVSAVTVTGLTVVDTATHWSFFGQLVIAVGMSLGGFGVVTMAAMLALVVSRRLGLTQRLLSAGDTQGRLSDAGTLFFGVLASTLIVEAVLFLTILGPLLRRGHDAGKAVWSAAFMAISAFNNAGFVNLPEGMAPYAGSWGVLLPLMMAAVIGAVGFPVITDLRRHWRQPKSWSLHTKLTLTAYFTLMVGSGVVVAALEWNNPATFGALNGSEKLLNAIVESVNPRSLGVSAVDVGDMTDATWLVTDLSMFIGGGSGSHAGGIKVTTFVVLLLAAWTEARGKPDVEAFRRRIPHSVVRQSVAVLLLAVALVTIAALGLLVMTPYSLDRVLFESVSAFGTVGLSTGLTPFLPHAGKLLLAVLMVAGRVGPMTLAAALALQNRHTVVQRPQARPMVG